MKFWQNLGKNLSKAALLLGSIALLAACSNPEVEDLKAISEAVKATGYSKEANQKFQDRLMAAKSEEEQKAIVEEMLVFFRPLPEKLNALNLQSEEGKAIRNNLSQGMGEMVAGIEKGFQLDAKDPNNAAAMMEAQKQMMSGQQKLMAAQTQLAAAAAKHKLKFEE